jgi:hypothetical protein
LVTQTNKLIFWIALMAVTLHYLLLGAQKLKLSEKARLYTYPLFDQNWQLFAPPPHENYQVLALLEDGTNIWLDADGIKLKGEIKGNSEMLLNALSNNLHFFIHSGKEKKDFLQLEKYIQNSLRHHSLPKAKKIAVILRPTFGQKDPSIYTN